MTDFGALFSIPEEIIYVNNAAVGMVPTASIRANIEFLEKLCIYGEPPLEEIIAKFGEMRKYAAQFFWSSTKQPGNK